MWSARKKLDLPTADEALPGRPERLPVPLSHAVLSTPLDPPYAEGLEVVSVGMGCFWGAERIFWQLPGVVSTSVGYQGGSTPNPTYEEVCSGRTGHAEAVRIVFDPTVVPYDDVLRTFWEGHDPTQGMRQGNDIGTQYRSAIYTTSDAQLASAKASREVYAAALAKAGRGDVSTEILPAVEFYPAEAYHQQYLHKNPNGYCGIGGTGVSCPIGVGVAVD
ncbi:MAG: peptide-methionine (S)-S-oxide reductase MsrA [Mycobacteriales bacterium]